MIDSHAHVADEQFKTDREQVAARAQAAGVTGWIEIGTTLMESRAANDLASQYDSVWASVGVHPDEVGAVIAETWLDLEKLVEHPKVVAIGEVGFDFYRAGTESMQRPALEQFITLAHAHALPMVFHVRDGEQSAHDALLRVLESLAPTHRPRGVIHTFSGNREQAKRYIDLGLHVSFSGVITFKNAGELLAVIEETPLEKILIETDCPYLAPEPYRGKRNEPAYVTLVAQKIAEIKGIPVGEVDRMTTSNTNALFQLEI